ncbi:MAG: fructosamine kinase family protein [Methylococcales bacterium]
MDLFLPIEKQIAAATGQAFNLRSSQALRGGDINAAYRLQGDSKAYFVKLNHRHLVEMFAAEFTGLQELAKTNTIRVPNPIVYGQTAKQAFLVLEFMAFGTSGKTSARLFG